MATWPVNGDTDWNTKMLAYLAVSFNTDGTPKKSAFGFSAYTNKDSEDNAMLKSHAYKAAMDGEVSASVTGLNKAEYIRVYVHTAAGPAESGDLVDRHQGVSDVQAVNHAVHALVAKDEYFEITCTNTPKILWKSIGTLSAPIDQD